MRIIFLYFTKYFYFLQVRCCGANGSEDYIAALKPVPMECRDQVDGGEYPYGCAQQFAWWLGMVSNTW